MKKILSIMLVGITMISLFTGCDKKENNEGNDNTENNNVNIENNQYEKENIVYELNENSETYKKAIIDFTLTYNGKTLKYPFKLKDVQTLGLEVDEYYLTKNVAAKTGQGNIRIYLEGENLTLNVTNDTNTDLQAGECIVDYASTANTSITINGITPGKSTYEDVLKSFGRDTEKRKNTYKNELLRHEKDDDFDYIMSYSVRDENRIYSNLTLNLDFDTIDGKDKVLDKVAGIEYSKY